MLDFSKSTTNSSNGSTGEGSRRLHGSLWHPSSPWRWTTGIDRKEAGSSAVSHPRSPLHHKAASDDGKCVTALYGFNQWVPWQCKYVLFQHAFGSPCIWAEFEINIVWILFHFVIPLQKGSLQCMLSQMCQCSLYLLHDKPGMGK